MDTVAKKEAITHHYDVGNDFYQLWLDVDMVYSCALWVDDQDNDLHQAQLNKLDWHLDNLSMSDGGLLLDIGCGWGALLQRHLDRNKANRGVGLTLSEAQKLYVDESGLHAEVIVQNWTEHPPILQYDGIISIGAFEHFANRHQSVDEKLELYSDFFSRCARWLKPEARLSLQTIVYGSMSSKDQNLFISDDVFPNSELPTVAEIKDASDSSFELIELRLDGKQYAKTCDLWLTRLRENKSEAVRLYGEETFQHYVKYLKFCVIGFYSGRINLARFVFSAKTGRIRS